jgi:hypothetical protein
LAFSASSLLSLSFLRFCLLLFSNYGNGYCVFLMFSLVLVLVLIILLSVGLQRLRLLGDVPSSSSAFFVKPTIYGRLFCLRYSVISPRVPGSFSFLVIRQNGVVFFVLAFPQPGPLSLRPVTM